VRRRYRHLQRTISHEHHAPADTSPTIYHSPPQDRRQPSSLSAPAFEVCPTLPRTAQRVLHDILRIMRVAHQAVSDTIQRRSMIVDQNTEVCPRKRHPCLSVSPVPRDNRLAVAVIQCITCRLSIYISPAFPGLIPARRKKYEISGRRCRNPKRQIELGQVPGLLLISRG